VTTWRGGYLANVTSRNLTSTAAPRRPLAAGRWPPAFPGSVLRRALFAAALVAVVTGVWAGLALKGPFRAMRTPQTRAQAAATAESIARAAAAPPSG